MTIANSRACQVGAEESLAFVKSLTAPPKTVLDVGCGDGTLARLLSDNGFVVTAIDDNDEAIAKARELGLHCDRANFLEFESEQNFDVLVFSRSLHHIHPVEAAVNQAVNLLKEGGLIIVEEFGAELVDYETAVWFFGMKAFIEAGEKGAKWHGPKLENGRIPADPLKQWREHHFGKHEVTPSNHILEALRRHFEPKVEARLPYLYRYFLDNITSAQAQQLMHVESALCEAKVIRTIGLRFAGKKKPADL
jgi:SAM-dependent methyltransferase